MFWIGTSGYNYPEWKGTFYPSTFPAARMLPFYAERFPTVEINYTFYRMPTPAVAEGWTRATPDRFLFTLKAPQRITHVARLQDCEPAVRAFLEAASALGSKRGPLLFQLAPNHRKNLQVLEAFLGLLPPHAQAAFEFRHESWFDPSVFAALRAHHAALCVADSARLSSPVEITTDFAYFRLRDEGYTSEDLHRWADIIRERTGACRDVFVYFKHEESGVGPALARQLTEELEARPPRPAENGDAEPPHEDPEPRNRR